jgi:hypothetical protein
VGVVESWLFDIQRRRNAKACQSAAEAQKMIREALSIGVSPEGAEKLKAALLVLDGIQQENQKGIYKE